MKIIGCMDEGTVRDHTWLWKPLGDNALCQISMQRKVESPSDTEFRLGPECGEHQLYEIQCTEPKRMLIQGTRASASWVWEEASKGAFSIFISFL